MNGKQPNAQKKVDILIVGAGPCTLGLMCNAIKTNRLNELINTGDGIAILEMGLGFGGGDLQEYGINSNTSANGFLKCCYKKRDIFQSPEKSNSNAKKTSPKSDDDSGGDELAEDSEREEKNEETHANNQKKFEWVALNCF